MTRISTIEKVNTAHLFPKFIDQLNKDIGVPLFNYGDRGIENLQEKLLSHLTSRPEQIDDIIYRADVSEHKARGLSPDNFLDELTLLILQRVAQKVIFRDQYSSG